MTRKLAEHGLSIALVTAIFIILILVSQRPATREYSPTEHVALEYLSLDFLNFGNPLDKALFQETLNTFYPDSVPRNDSLLQAIEDLRREEFTNELYKTGAGERGLNAAKLATLARMYLQFIVIYLIVMVLCYYGAQTIGALRFVAMNQDASFSKHWPVKLGVEIVTFAAYMILFAPAYVIAYSLKTKFDTDSYLFMVLFGVISNGLLINYANKFFTFLVGESRKGYVETASAKNLYSSYAWGAPDGIAWKSVWRMRKEFPHHVFQHIYVNAHYQFVPTLKEFASFLVTGLVIIEMALNIQGHLSYEMLKNILHKQHDVVLGILLAIFLLVKTTEVAVDAWTERLARTYENR